jgi:predicted MFS family arabinose efflux permease
MRYIASSPGHGNGVNIERWVRSLLIVSALGVALMAGLVGVSQLKFTSFLSDSINGRLEVVAATAAQDFAAATDLGLSLEQVANGEAILERARRHDHTITAIYVIDIDGEILHATGDTSQAVDDGTLEAFGLAASGVGEKTWDTEDAESIRSGTLIEGSFGQPVGGVVVEYPSHELLVPSRSMARSLIAIGAVVSLIIIVVSGAVMVIANRRDNEQDPGTGPEEQARKGSRAFAIALSVVLILGVVGFGVLTVPAFNSELAPELERRAALIGETIVDDTERAVDIGIPITKLVGVDEYFDEYLDRFPEINHLAIRATDGTSLYSSDRITEAGVRKGAADSDIYQFAIGAESVQGGVVDVGVDSGFVNSRLRDLALDVIVILIVALVIMFEIFRVAGRSLSPMSSTGAEATAATETLRGVASIRMVLFLFVVGEELNKSFLPLFIESAENPIPGISSSVAISLPIAAYLLAIAVASPFSRRLIAAFGTRGLFLIGVVPAALSHLGMVYADNVVQIVALRTMTGVGYALATIACLDYVLDRVGTKGRAKGIGAFVAVVIGGTFVGTALGGIIADRLGYSTVFLISFALVVTAGLLGLRLLARATPGPGEMNDLFSIRDMKVVLKQPSLMLLMAGVTVPMNVLMAAFLWYLVPITMASIGSTATAIARTLMVYYLVILLGSPVVARISTRGVNNWALVGFGSVISGVILILPARSPTVLSISVAVLVVGIGHAAVRGPQIDLAIEIAERELPGVGRDPVLAAMRSIERLGSLVGLLVVAILIAQFDLSTAIAAIGIVSVIAGVAYIALRRSTSRSLIDA